MPLGTCFPRENKSTGGDGLSAMMNDMGGAGFNGTSKMFEVKDDAMSYSSSAPKLPQLATKGGPKSRHLDMPAYLVSRGDSGGALVGKLARGGQHGFKGVPPGPKANPETARLLLNITVMRASEAEEVGGRVRRALEGADGAKVCEAFVTRVCEILCGLRSGELHKAPGLMEQIAGLATKEDPAQIIEQRICVLAQASSDDIGALVPCRAVALELMQTGFLSDKAFRISMESIDRWMQKVPLREMRRHVEVLADLTAREKQLRLSLEQRLSKQAFILSGAGQLRAFAQLLLELRAGGVRAMEAARKPKLDEASAVPLPLLQWALLGTIRDALRNWPMDKLMVEFTGPMVKLPRAAGNMEPMVLAAVTKRALTGLDNVSQMIQRRADPVRVQAELIIWARYVCQVGEVGLLDFDGPTRRRLLGGPLDPASMDFCLKAIHPSAAEFPPEYLPRVAPLRPRLAEVEEIAALAREHVLAAGPRAQVHKVETRVEEAANPFVTVVEEEEADAVVLDEESLAKSSKEESLVLEGELERVVPARIQVVIEWAKNLRDADRMAGSSDPYTICKKVNGGSEQIKTKVIDSSQDPVWYHIGELGSYDGHSLLFEVFDSDSMKGRSLKKDDFLGRVVVSGEQLSEAFNSPAGVFEAELVLLESGREGAVLKVKVLPQ